MLRVTLARPGRRNAFDAALIDELTAAFADVGDARAVVLRGDGPSFSAGADVEWMRSSVELSFDENVADALRLRALLDAIDGCPAPVVAARAGARAGRRLRSRRVLRHRDRVAGRAVRVQRGEAGHRPGGHLPVRAREDRPGRRAPLVRHRRAVRRRDRAANRPRARGRGRSRRCRVASRRGAPGRRPPGGAGGEAPRPRPTLGRRDRAPDRAAPDERRGPGGPPRLPRETAAWRGA